jgi:toxin ParE1/3/4
MKVIWSETAIRDLETAHAYLEQHSSWYALRIINRLVAAADVLGDFPEMGRSVPERSDNVYRELIHSPYRIIYRAENQVHIVAVIHSARGELPLLP